MCSGPDTQPKAGEMGWVGEEKKFLVNSAASHGVVSCKTLDELVFKAGQDGRDSFCLGSRERRKVSRALVSDMDFKEKEDFFLGNETDDDNHYRLFWVCQPNQSENFKGERKLKGTELRSFITSSLPVWRPRSRTRGLCIFL